MARVWKEEKEKTFGLVVAFTGGFLGHAHINYEKRKARVYEVVGMIKEYDKRSAAVSKRLRRYYKGKLDDPQSSS